MNFSLRRLNFYSFRVVIFIEFGGISVLGGLKWGYYIGWIGVEVLEVGEK